MSWQHTAAVDAWRDISEIAGQCRPRQAVTKRSMTLFGENSYWKYGKPAQEVACTIKYLIDLQWSTINDISVQKVSQIYIYQRIYDSDPSNQPGPGNFREPSGREPDHDCLGAIYFIDNITHRRYLHMRVDMRRNSDAIKSEVFQVLSFNVQCRIINPLVWTN